MPSQLQRRSVAMAMTFAMVTLGACNKPNRAKRGIEVTDDLGVVHVLAKPAQRIVSLSPALTEVLFALGCGEALVLRDGWSDHPRAARKVPMIKGLKPSAESVLAARPDAVLTSFPPAALRTGLRGADVPLLAFNPVTLQQVASTFVKIGTICGKRSDGEQLAADFRAELTDVRKMVQGRRRPRVLLELDAGGDGQYYTVGKGSFGHELIREAGGDNVFAQSPKAWFQVSREAVVDANPEVVLLASARGRGHRRTPKAVAARPGWRAMTAVKTGRVYPVTADWVSRPGPRLALGLRHVASLLHPQVFGLPSAATGTAEK